MPAPFQHAVIVGKFQAHGIEGTLDQVATFVEGHGLRVSFDERTAATSGTLGRPVLAMDEIRRLCDLAIVIGGDGTMLGMARELAPSGVPLIGINQGRLGFITDIPFDRFRDALAPVLEGHYEEERRAMIDGSVWRDGEPIFAASALNDVVVSRGAIASMVEVRVEIDGDFMANMRADGVIVCTPTGSTAYSLSAGGPLLHPRIGGWVLLPIASHTLTNRPIVVPDDGEVRIDLVAGREGIASFDTHAMTDLRHGDQVRMRRSTQAARFLHPHGWSYYATLRRKLRWYEGGA